MTGPSLWHRNSPRRKRWPLTCTPWTPMTRPTHRCSSSKQMGKLAIRIWLTPSKIVHGLKAEKTTTEKISSNLSNVFCVVKSVRNEMMKDEAIPGPRFRPIPPISAVIHQWTRWPDQLTSIAGGTSSGDRLVSKRTSSVISFHATAISAVMNSMRQSLRGFIDDFCWPAKYERYFWMLRNALFPQPSARNTSVRQVIRKVGQHMQWIGVDKFSALLREREMFWERGKLFKNCLIFNRISANSQLLPVICSISYCSLEIWRKVLSSKRPFILQSLRGFIGDSVRCFLQM